VSIKSALKRMKELELETKRELLGTDGGWEKRFEVVLNSDGELCVILSAKYGWNIVPSFKIRGEEEMRALRDFLSEVLGDLELK